MFKKLFLGTAAVAAVAGLLAMPSSLIAQMGMFFGYPIVGGASYCITTLNPAPPNANGNGAGQTGQCVATAPAGPTSLTGNELYIVQTNVAGTQQPQSVYVPQVLAAAGAYSVVVPVTTNNVVVPTNISTLIISPAGTIAALTLTMPVGEADGSIVTVLFTATVTTLTVAANGSATFSSTPPTTALNGASLTYMYNATLNEWFKLHSQTT